MEDIEEKKKESAEEVASAEPAPETEGPKAEEAPAEKAAPTEEAVPETEAEGTGTQPDPTEPAEPEAPAEPEESPKPASEPEPEERLFTQRELDAIVQKRIAEVRDRAFREGRESAIGETRSKYGVDTDEELDELFGAGQRYDALDEEYGTAKGRITELEGENALLRSGISPDRWEDVKAIAAYNGMNLDHKSIERLLEGHPEWKGKADAPKPAPAATIRKLGGEPSREEPIGATEEEEAMRLLGLGK